MKRLFENLYKKSDKKIITISLIVILLMLSVGISFAVWNYGFLGEVNKIETGDIEIEFLESNTDIISIEDALPMGDNEGKAQSKTFDFQVRTKTLNKTDIGYSLILERVQTLCGDLESPNKDVYPECYNTVISDTDKDKLISYIVTLNIGGGKSIGYVAAAPSSNLTTEQATELYNYIIAHDKEGIYNFYISMGAWEEDAQYIANMFEAEGYELYLIELYQNNTGETINPTYELKREEKVVEKNLCSDLENPNRDDYQECYNTVISDTDKNKLISFLAEVFGATTEQATELYNAIIAHDKEGIYNFWISIGNSEEDAQGFADELEYLGYEVFLIDWYQNNTGETITLTYEFDNTKTYGNIEQLRDEDVKIYLEDYQGNVLLEPTKISDISRDYVIYTKINSHDSTNENIKDKYKLRVWVNGEIDSSDWNATEKHQYKFKIGVKTKLKESDVSADENPEISDFKYTVKYNSNGGKGTMENSTFVYNQTVKLSKNTYARDHYTFKGWSTKATSNQVVYNDESEIKNLTDVYHGIVNLYAVWEPDIYTIDVVVQNGTINGETIKQVEYNKTATFNISTTGNKGYNEPIVTCTNNQNATLKNGILEIENVTSDTTCTIEYVANIYKVRYNANGGYFQGLEMSSTGTNSWKEIDGVYRSGNYNVASSTSTLTSEEFTLTETATISFDWASSSEDENYDYLYYTIYKDGSALSDTGTSTKIGGNSSIKDEANLTYTTVEKELEAGTYTIEFTYKKDSAINGGLDRGYVKNIALPSINKYNSTFTYDVEATLKSNKFVKEGYTFQGWSTSESAGTVNYQNGATIKNLTSENNKIIDLYAVWEINSYDVNVVVQNGTVDTGTKSVEHGQNGIFNLTPGVDGAQGRVTCTNNQTGSITNNVLTVSNVTKNTTCTVKYVTEMTTLYTDGTLIINENLANRSSNITTHGAVTNEYDAMSSSNSYVMNSYSAQPWANERDNITSIEIDNEIHPTSTAYWFHSLRNVSYGNFTNLKTESVRNMSYMFSSLGHNSSSPTFELIGLDNWDTSSVTKMSYMFGYFYLNSGSGKYGVGYKATTWSIGDLSGWNTSSVTNMSYMFREAGYSATTWSIGDLSGWDTSSVTSMSDMFMAAGRSATTWSIGDLSSWDTSSVTDMSYMFYEAGYSATTFNIGDLSGWDTSSVISMSLMFYGAGYKATTFELDLSGWDTSSVTNMIYMFQNAGRRATTWSIGDLSSWDTSKVTNMGSMFYYAGKTATTFNIGDLSSWNTSSVTNMSSMFESAGNSATTFNIGDLSSWDTSSVTSMSNMFKYAGYTATWSLDCSSWNVNKVTSHSKFNTGVESKVTAPTWVN